MARGQWKDRAAQRAHCQQIGGKGGQRTVEIYGPAVLRELARAGFETTCERYYGGNRAYARAALIARGRHFSKHRAA